MENPIKKGLDKLGISTHAAAKVLSSPGDKISQPSVYRHCTGERRISADSMEKYNSRLGINMTEMRKWNKYLKN